MYIFLISKQINKLIFLTASLYGNSNITAATGLGTMASSSTPNPKTSQICQSFDTPKLSKN